MGKALIYVRVSDPRQIDRTSLGTQESMCRAWCELNQLDIAQVFIERGESAKTADRTQLQAMLEMVRRTKKGLISHVVVYKLDRWSRNVAAGLNLEDDLLKRNVALYSVTEPNENTPQGRYIRLMLQGQAQFDNEVRAERCLLGMKTRLAQGKWMWRAPYGYRRGAGASEPSLVPDKRAKLVKKLFELVASGNHTKASALAAATALGLRSDKGLPLTQETIRKTLISPIYIGRIEYPKWSVSVKGDFSPLVSQSVFDRAQTVLSGRAPVSVPHVQDRDEFPLRGLLICADCLKPVTASFSTGKSGSRFGYYRCHRVKGHMNVSAKRVEVAFVELLQRLIPKQERVELLGRIFRAS